MATNDFLPFGIAGGAPVDNQPAYAARTPGNGFAPGLLPKEYINKAMRQATSMAAALGGVINAAGINANDDGNIAALTAALIAGFAASSSVSTHFSLATADGSAATRSVLLVPGTWQVSLQTIVAHDDITGNFDSTSTQAANLGATGISTGIRLYRSGGSGFGRFGFGMQIVTGTLVQAAAGSVTMAMAAVTLNGNVSRGSILHVEKIA